MYRAGEQNIVDRQRELLQAQTQLSSGKRIATPSDDPLGAADATYIRSSLAAFEQFKDNQGYARYMLNLGESALADIVTAVQDAQEKLIAAGNGAYGDGERRMIAADLEGLLGRIVGLANSGDGAGGYLFAGSKERTMPFSQSGNVVSFWGDEVLQQLEVSKGRFQQIKYSGDALFNKMRPGNGSFTTDAAGTNAGTAWIDAGSVIDPTALTGRPYTITIAEPTPGQFTYTVERSDPGPVLTVVGTGSYTEPTELSFDGVRVSLNGTPAAGDSFSVTPSGYRSVFDTLATAVSLLRTGIQGNPRANAQFQTDLGGLQASLGQALDHLLLKRADIGTALQELDAYERLNDDRALEYQTRLSGVEDLDFAKGAAELSRRQATFQAALQSYSTVSKLSLFDYL
jgi:flagellar hook-associated protein 3 FlgL